VRDPRFLIEALLAILLTVVVYVQTQRLSEQAANQSEELNRWSENIENIRFVRETVIGDSLVMPFGNMDLSYASFTGLHFGCTDEERERARSWRDSASDPRYVGLLCRAAFGRSNLAHVDFQGSQLHGAIFEGATLAGSNLLGTNLIDAWFTNANLDNANLQYSLDE
jgi:uncharacterized protein YjbI with pentapeptide repeats